MITTLVLRAIWSIVQPILSRVPNITITADGAFVGFLDYVRAALYFLPMNTFIRILTLVLGLWILRIVIAVLHSLWAALPVV